MVVARVLLLAAALILFIASWLVGLLPKEDWKALHGAGPTLRAWATAPVLLYGLLEAVHGFLQRRGEAKEAELLDIADSIMAELEESCIRNGETPRIHHCSVAAWRVREARWYEWKKKGEEPALEVKFRRRMRNKTSRTGVSWRRGKGVIGMTVRDGQPSLVNVDELWQPLLNCTPEEWATQPEDVRMGLTFDEFTKAAQRKGAYVDNAVGPVIIAMPIAQPGSAKVIGCAALDCPPSMFKGAEDSQILWTLVRSLGQAALGVRD